MKNKAKKPEYRFYGFGNYYLSSLQQGLQAGHAAVELFVQHKEDSDKYKMVKKWGKSHKTMVLLNGGNSFSLTNLHKLFKKWEKMGMPYPFSKFNEDKVSLNEALTYVSIILPDEIYDIAQAVRHDTDALISLMDWDSPNVQWKVELIEELNKYSLAH